MTPTRGRSPTPTHAATHGIGGRSPWIGQKTTERITKLTDRDDLRAAARELFADVGKRPPGPRLRDDAGASRTTRSAG